MDIFKYFSINIREILIENISVERYEMLEEIRLRNEKKIFLKFRDKLESIDYVVSTEELLETLQLISENSIYSYQNQICNGFITLKGGHRVGLTGNVSYEDDKVLNINYIYSLNFRIAREVIGCSRNIIDYIYDYKNNTIYNTLIVGTPGSR